MMLLIIFVYMYEEPLMAYTHTSLKVLLKMHCKVCVCMHACVSACVCWCMCVFTFFSVQIIIFPQQIAFYKYDLKCGTLQHICLNSELTMSCLLIPKLLCFHAVTLVTKSLVF